MGRKAILNVSLPKQIAQLSANLEKMFCVYMIFSWLTFRKKI